MLSKLCSFFAITKTEVFRIDMSTDKAKKARSNPRLFFEIAVVLCCKLAVIFALWYFFFGPDKRLEQTPENVASGILERAPAAKNGH